MPTSYVGHHIYLDEWFIFDGEDWEEWRFGFNFLDDNGGAN
jgi:hypothetical protein